MGSTLYPESCYKDALPDHEAVPASPFGYEFQTAAKLTEERIAIRDGGDSDVGCVLRVLEFELRLIMPIASQLERVRICCENNILRPSFVMLNSQNQSESCRLNNIN